MQQQNKRVRKTDKQTKSLKQAVHTESIVAHSYSNEGLISYDDFFRGNLTVC